MIGKTHEFVIMHQSETELWWYKYLHSQVSNSIAQHAGNQTSISILDAGCGTGGLLLHLQKNGYKHLWAFDASEDAVTFATNKTSVAVQHGRIEQTTTLFHEPQFDVVCCMDVFTYLTDDGIIDVLKQFVQCLKPGGIIITNNNAFKAFKGTHDYHVNIQKRFVRQDFEKYATEAHLALVKNRYWNFLLSPLVYIIRKWKLLLYHSGLVNKSNISSDLEIPLPFINNNCLRLLQWEEKAIPNPIWGTSVFTVLKKMNNA